MKEELEELKNRVELLEDIIRTIIETHRNNEKYLPND